MGWIFMFDGQGAFKPGVGRELSQKYPKADEILKAASGLLGYDVGEFLWGEKAAETSGRTSVAQPLISAVSIAYADIMDDLGVQAEVSTGHSLGEITALIYCGVLSFENGMKVIQRRGELMEKSGKDGTMIAILNIDRERLEQMCRNASQEMNKPVVVANINGPGQIVISGSPEPAQRVAQLAVGERGRAIVLRVGGAWHSPLLEDGSREFAQFLNTVEFRRPARRFYSVVEQKVLEDESSIKSALKGQMLAQVDWVRTINNLAAMGHRDFLEIGPSRILKDLAAKIQPELRIDSTALHKDLEELTKNS